MRPLQDQCEPTPFKDLENLFLSDIGVPLSELFSELDSEPIGVASLAQVHRGRLRATGQEVAVKVRFRAIPWGKNAHAIHLQLQHPHLAEFCDIDMEMVEVSLGMCMPGNFGLTHSDIASRLDQASLPRIRVHLARRRNAGKPSKGDGLLARSAQRLEGRRGL